MSFAIFNEQSYLASYSDVQAAVQAGAFQSGREHFEKHGLREGRVLVSPYYDEAAYLQKYPDVAAAVANGSIPSGLAHYILVGEAEGRSGTAFDEEIYSLLYPDVTDAVEAGSFSSGLDHFIKFGQFENRAAFFTGTNGSDRITAFGQATFVSGVNFLNPGNSNPQVDTLIGGNGLDLFVLDDYYIGRGNADYAIIQNFDVLDLDFITFTGQPGSYIFQVANGSTNISTTAGDLVATVQGATNLTVLTSDPFSNTFSVG